MPGRSFVGANGYRYGFNGKENDNEVKGNGNQQDYGMRIYDPRLGRFLSVDPITKKYPELTPYQFASNSPIWGVDWDGLELRIYTETKGTGHTFITVQDGDDVIVYTYGRFANSDASTGGATGQGVLIRYTGDKAKDYIKSELYRMEAKAFQVDDADEKAVQNFMDAQYFGSSESPNTGDEDIDKYGKIIDSYNLFGNNCTTISCDATKAGGADVFNYNGGEQDFAIPKSLQNYLQDATVENINVNEVTGTMKGTYQNTLDKKPLGSAGVGGETSGSSGKAAGSSANTSSGNASSSGGNSGSSSKKKK
ncbi:MAG: RHS repeat-associated core domain-containing protein [Bacteroidia bacterium]|nr:RHS repeat-associated core domain-containing protein [Bacteroidia bacterium]